MLIEKKNQRNEKEKTGFKDWLLEFLFAFTL